MKLTAKEAETIRTRITQMMDEISELTGGAACLLLLEQQDENADWEIRTWSRGSPYANARMAEVFSNQDHNDDLAAVIAKSITPPDDGEDWKG